MRLKLSFESILRRTTLTALSMEIFALMFVNLTTVTAGTLQQALKVSLYPWNWS
ncbi:hypothetical protein [Xanthomonas phage BUDD]|nr:hypothetical protein [Xanthomonas phage BUDD]